MKTTYVYTDGSVFNNQRKESLETFGGIGAFFGIDDERNISEPFYLFPITNNRTEIQAASRAIETFMTDKMMRGDKEKEKLVIMSDSEYMINLITKWINKWKLNMWKTANGKDVKNKDLIYNLDHILNLYKSFVKVEFQHTKAHRKKIPEKGTTEYKEYFGNMMADKLAKRGTTIAMKAMGK